MITRTETAYGPIISELTADRYLFRSIISHPMDVFTVHGVDLHVTAEKENGKPTIYVIEHLGNIEGQLPITEEIVEHVKRAIQSIVRDITLEMRFELEIEKLKKEAYEYKRLILEANSVIMLNQHKLQENEIKTEDYKKIKADYIERRNKRQAKA